MSIASVLHAHDIAVTAPTFNSSRCADDTLRDPPPDPSRDECDAHEARSLSFAVTSDSVILSGNLPRLEGELVIAAVDALAEGLRSEADHVPAGARRADGLVALVNAAHAGGSLPSRGGLPVSLSVVVRTTELGDQVWSTSRGHDLTASEQRFAGCDALVTPILVRGADCPPAGGGPAPRGPAAPGGTAHDPGTHDPAAHDPGTHDPAAHDPAARIAALAATLFDTHQPLDVGRYQRTATPAQRRALAVRDGGCVIPGCGVPAEACQTHHVREWAAGGPTDIANMVLACWAHHRQVDLGMWTIHPAGPGAPPGQPSTGAPPGTPWPANNGAPWVIVRTPRRRWRS